MKFLTFNHHESYLCALAGLGEEFDVVVKKGDLDLSWNVRARPVPANFRLVAFEDAREQIHAGAYSYIICHTLKTLLWLFPLQRKRLIFVIHINLFRDTFVNRVKSLFKRGIVLFWQKAFGLKVMSVSESKRLDWRVPCAVAKNFPVPFAPELLAPRKTDEVRGAFVGNRIKERGGELGWPVLEQVLKTGSIDIIGYNPDIPGAIIPKDFPEFVARFSAAHFYVYPIPPEQGDGYNLGSLEAMLLGQPVVSLVNPTSPIRDGVNGLLAQDAAGMIAQIERLKGDEALRLKLGAGARETVRKEFSPEQFWAAWRQILDLEPSR